MVASNFRHGMFASISCTAGRYYQCKRRVLIIFKNDCNCSIFSTRQNQNVLESRIGFARTPTAAGPIAHCSRGTSGGRSSNASPLDSGTAFVDSNGRPRHGSVDCYEK